MQDLSLCFFLLDIVLYFLDQYLHLNRWPMCTSFQCLFSTLRLWHTFSLMGQVLVFGKRGVFACEASFSPKLLGPPQPLSSSRAVTGSACGEGRLVALPWGL